MERTRKIFTYALPIIIVLNGYASGIMGLSIGSIVMNLFNLYALFCFVSNNHKIDSFFTKTALWLISFIILSCFSYIIYGIADIRRIVVSLLKMATWFIGVTFTVKLFFDYTLFKIIYKKFCLFCTLYLFIQMISWNILRFYLPNIFNFGPLKPLYDQYSAESYVNYLSAIGFGRFSSFFAEPAYYGILMIISLVIILFDEYEKEELPSKYKVYAILLILGIWCSTSTASIIFVMFVICAYFYKSNIKDKAIILLLVVVVGMVMLSKGKDNPLTSFFITKVTTMNDSGRVGGSYEELLKLNFLQMLFGVGMSNEAVITDTSYFNAITGIIVEYGIIGFIIFISYLINMYFKSKSCSLHVLMIIYVAAMSQGGYLFNLYGILIFSLIQNIGKSVNNSTQKSIF